MWLADKLSQLGGASDSWFKGRGFEPHRERDIFCDDLRKSVRSDSMCKLMIAVKLWTKQRPVNKTNTNIIIYFYLYVC